MSNMTFIKTLSDLFINGTANSEKKQLEKIKFLTEKTYDHYINSQPIVISDIDIPHFMYYEQRRRRAVEETIKEMTKVIEECRVNECFKKCVRLTKSK